MILFAALTLPPDTVAALQALQAGVPIARWRPADTFHVTLRYFDEVDDERAAALRRALQAIRLGSFGLQIAGVGIFKRDRNSVLWAAVAKHPGLVALASACDDAAGHAGLRPARSSRFFPHVTLAYLAAPPNEDIAAWLAAHRDLALPTVSVRSFVLQESERGQDRVHHRVVERFDLVDDHAMDGGLHR